ncbi:hypothetical protein PAP_00565 [Palaeococcus pacificus DY20341]|uniref:KaiC-like domain-containing protein n=1 Tax=Palaeococcus pacificus DY20341 TaxID=1343739 RepID=A0A075LQH2_9EURY|nr:hypothetical protein [Palaeococcus pacificus]AIF68559.1 hypothetical protein PAP_00565 [Palaeococcus pacificus DY20341]
MNINELLKSIPRNGVLSIIERDLESNGELFGLLLLKKLLEEGKTVFVIVYDPILVFKENLEILGVDFEGVLGKNLFVFDVFGSIHRIERDFDGVYQVKGYIDDSVFVSKFRELLLNVMKGRNDAKELWFFTYLSSSVCKLFSKPIKTYKLILSAKYESKHCVEDIRAVAIYNSWECPELEGIIYSYSDIVIETFFKDGQKVGIITKGGEEIIFDLFGGD